MRSFEEWIVSRFQQAVSIQTPAGEDAYGHEIPGDDYDTFARVEPSSIYRSSREGPDILVAAQLFIEKDAPMSAGSRITYAGRVYTSVDGGVMVDLAGNPTHQEWQLRSA